MFSVIVNLTRVPNFTLTPTLLSILNVTIKKKRPWQAVELVMWSFGSNYEFLVRRYGKTACITFKEVVCSENGLDPLMADLQGGLNLFQKI